MVILLILNCRNLIKIVPITLVTISILALEMHPHPKDPCPCYEDSHCFLSAWTGGMIGAWNRSRIPASYPFQLSLSSWFLRPMIGIPLILVWRLISKSLFQRILAICLKHDNSKTSSSPYKILKWTPSMMSKYLVYVGIGILATDIFPRLFNSINI